MITTWGKIIFDNPKKLLDQFSEYVEEKRLCKVSYTTWRDLVRWIQSADKYNCQVGIQFNKKDELEIYWSNRDVADYTLKRVFPVHEISWDDISFGTFAMTLLEGSDQPWEESKPIFYDRAGAPIVKRDKNVNIAVSISDLASSAEETGAALTNLSNRIKDYTNDIKERENRTMKFNFNFGTCENDNVKMSPYGLAVKNNDSVWVSYDIKSGNLIDVDIFNFDCGKYLFKMPVAIKDVKIGDVVIHQHIPMYVVDLADGITVIDPRAGERKTILLTRSPFGFDFVTKVVNLLDGALGGTPTTDNPFGNMLPFFLMSNSNKDIDPLMMAMMLNGGCAVGTANPMMLALLCGDQTNMRDVLPLMMLAGQGNSLFNQPAAK